jgi:hypothetical protein
MTEQDAAFEAWHRTAKKHGDICRLECSGAWDAALAHQAEWVQAAARLANEVAVTLHAWDAKPGGDELREIFEAKMGDLGTAFNAYMALEEAPMPDHPAQSGKARE